MAAALLPPAILAAVLGGCGGTTGNGTAGRGPVQVVAAFYPLAWIAEQVGGDAVDVTALTRAGAEPHDLELTPRDVARISDADLVVYLAGFQPAVDDAIGREVAASYAFDAGQPAHLDLPAGTDGASHDPHFWLDPLRLKAVALDLAERLAGVDRAHAELYRANARAVARELDALDAELRQGLTSCQNRVLVTSHKAFGYLSERYGLRQVSITGLSPEEEASPRDLASVSDLVRANHARTVYVEPLMDPALAETLARESGARTALLDPIEGLNDRSQGPDYPAIMRADLESLKRGQPCP